MCRAGVCSGNIRHHVSGDMPSSLDDIVFAFVILLPFLEKCVVHERCRFLSIIYAVGCCRAVLTMAEHSKNKMVAETHGPGIGIQWEFKRSPYYVMRSRCRAEGVMADCSNIEVHADVQTALKGDIL